MSSPSSAPAVFARGVSVPPPTGYANWFVYCADQPTAAVCADVRSFYNYRLNLAANVAFLTLFSLSAVVFLLTWLGRSFVWTPGTGGGGGQTQAQARAQMLPRHFRGSFFSVSMLAGCACEILGYAGRVLSWHNQWSQLGFFMQIVCLTIGPAFISAAIYICLQRVIVIYGPRYSLIGPANWTKIFIPCDILSLILQAAGGGMASAAFHNNTNVDPGDNVMLTGLALQVATMAFFIACALVFAFRVFRGRHDAVPAPPSATHKAASNKNKRALNGWEAREALRLRGTWPFRGFLVALALASVAVSWRCAYRVAELSKGWDGPLTYRQDLFIGFDGVMIVLACAALNAFNPLFALGCFVNDRGMAEAQRGLGGEEEEGMERVGSHGKGEGERERAGGKGEEQ